MTTQPLFRPARWPLFVAPLLVLAAIALLWISNEMVTILWFDRASFGWTVPVPMLLLAPAVAGLVARSVDGRAALAAAAATAIGLGLFVTAWLVAGIDRIGCDTTVDKVAILGRVAPATAVAALGYFLAATAAVRLRDRPVAAVLTGVSISAGSWFVALALFAAAFPALSCAYVPPPA